MQSKRDINGVTIKAGNRIKYSYNSIGLPVFTGVVIEVSGQLIVEHSNKATVPLDDKIEYIEVLPDLY